MIRRPVLPLAAVASGVGLALTLAVPALGDDPDQVLDTLPDSAWSESITRLNDNVTMLEERITHLETNITPLDIRTTEGEETVISLASDILFEFGKAEIDARAEDRIAEIVADLPDEATVKVHGHTDSIGERDFNQQLSEDRATTVAEVIGQERSDLELEVEGFGMDEPVEPNEVNGEDNPEGRALNRRVEIRYDG